MSIEFKGLEDVLGNLKWESVQKQVIQALNTSCAIVERSAKEYCPVDNGELRRSISSTVNESQFQGIVFTPLEYAPYVEYGTGLFAENGGRKDVPWNYQDEEGNWHSTSGQKPQPFMRPALDVNRDTINELLKEALKKKK